MLQSMRELAHSWYFKGLMLLLVVSFGIWNIGDTFRGNPLHRVVATAGSAEFTVQEVNKAFDQSLARARQMFQPDLTAQQAKQMGMADVALNDMIENSLFDQDLKRLGINAGDATVFSLLMQDPALKTKDGAFDKEALRSMLAQRRMSEREFIDDQRKDLASRQLVGGFTNLPPVPDFILDQLAKARAQKRVVEIVSVDSHAMPAPALDEAALRDYYQKNPQPFTAPETRDITLAVLTTDSVAKDITVSDDQVKKEYESKRDQLTEPEKRDLLQLVLQDEDKAREVAKAARDSGNLVAAAKPTGKMIVPLNGTEEATLLPELAKPVFALQEKGVTDPIKTPLGWHVIQLRKITPSGVPSFDSVKDKLRDSMKADQAADSVSRMVNQMDDDLAAGHALEDMAGSMKLHLIKIKGVNIGGKLPDGKDPAELPHKDDVLKSAFAQNGGETSPVLDDKNGNYFVVRTDAITPSAEKPFDVVKADVAARAKADAQEKAAAAEADRIAKAMREGKTAKEAIANVKGASVRLSKPLSMAGDADPTLPKSAMTAIMRLKKADAITLPPDNGVYDIARLSDVLQAASVDDELKGKVAGEFKTNQPKELADAYVRHLKLVFPVHIKPDALDSVAASSN